MLKELKEVRLDFLKHRTSFHLKAIGDTTNHIEKCEHYKLFVMFNDMFMEEKDGRNNS